MKNLEDKIFKEVMSRLKPKGKCECGCSRTCNKAPILKESKQYDAPISEDLRYHITNKIAINESVFRAASTSHINLVIEARNLWRQGIIELQGVDKELFENTDLGTIGLYEGQMVPLDFPIMEVEINIDTENSIEDEPITEKDSKKKTPPLGKPKRGGSKKFYVYVRDPKTKRIKKVSFGQVGMSAKINDPKARKAFAARHKCSQKTDRTKPSYWSCRLPRYAKLLGLKSTFSGYW
jgi:hypothetical protein